MATHDWEWDRRKGVVIGATLQVPWIIIRVHRHIHHEPDKWLMSCVQLGFDCMELDDKDLAGATAEALAIAVDRTKAYLAALELGVAGSAPATPTVSR